MLRFSRRPAAQSRGRTSAAPVPTLFDGVAPTAVPPRLETGKLPRYLYVLADDPASSTKGANIVRRAVNWYVNRPYIPARGYDGAKLLMDHAHALENLKAAQCEFQDYFRIFLCIEAVEVPGKRRFDPEFLRAWARSPLAYLCSTVVFYWNDDTYARVKGILNRPTTGEAWIEAIDMNRTKVQERRWFRGVTSTLERLRLASQPRLST